MGRNVSHNDSSMIEDFVAEVLAGLKLDFLVFDPDISEAILEDFNLLRVAYFDIGERIFSILKRFV
jgi:hypothetical protein